MRNFITIILVAALFTGLYGCEKFLDLKPNRGLTVPSELKDLQALLDDYNRINTRDPSGGEISSDNYYLTVKDWEVLDEGLRNMYLWEKGDFFQGFNHMWKNAFQTVYVSDVVLDQIKGIELNKENEELWKSVAGTALFARAKMFHAIAVTWALAFDSSTADTDPGIPLRLSSDFNKKSERSTLRQTYNQIINDLQQSVQYLPKTQISVYRPTKAAAYAVLARVYLSIRNYSAAGKYADSALMYHKSLMNYNELNPAAPRPIQSQNIEVLFHTEAGNWGPLTNSRAKIDSTLFASYDSNDLRKTIFFIKNSDGSAGFKATYTGTTAQFTGPATDELYLTRAECYARAGRVEAALSDLNTLLFTRWKSGTFIPFEANNAAQALELILKERRKQLLYRELRWMDIKRLNKEGANITLRRIMDEKEYMLPPNHPRFALPIPESVIKISGMQQNPR